MKKILLIVEKPSLADQFLNLAFNANDDVFTKNTLYLAFCHSGTAPVYDYPKNIKYKDYPKMNPLKLKWNEGFEKGNNASLHEKYKNTIQIRKEQDFEQDFDELYVLQDADYVGAYFALSLLQYLYGKEYENLFKKTTYANFLTYEGMYSEIHQDEVIKREIFKRRANAGYVKRWFQYNFNFNSSIFFTEILNHIGIKSEIKLSKYMVLMVHLLYNKKYTKKLLGFDSEEFMSKGISEAKLVYAMGDYKGSKKMVASEKMYLYGVGGPATRFGIFSNLLKLGLVKQDEKYIKPTENGYKLFNLLNKKTFDIDMPLRVDKWQERAYEGEDVSEEVSDYIYNYFVEQKRKNNKALPRFN